MLETNDKRSFQEILQSLSYFLYFIVVQKSVLLFWDTGSYFICLKKIWLPGLTQIHRNNADYQVETQKNNPVWNFSSVRIS